MPRDYRCTDCGEPCAAPIYLRLVLTRCGLKEARKQSNRHAAVRVGHCCLRCLAARLRTVIGHDLDLPRLFGGIFPGSTDFEP